MSGLYARPSSLFILSFFDWMYQASKVPRIVVNHFCILPLEGREDMCVMASYARSKVTSLVLRPGKAMMWQRMKKWAGDQTISCAAHGHSLPLSAHIMPIKHSQVATSMSLNHCATWKVSLHL